MKMMIQISGIKQVADSLWSFNLIQSPECGQKVCSISKYQICFLRKEFEYVLIMACNWTVSSSLLCTVRVLREALGFKSSNLYY